MMFVFNSWILFLRGDNDCILKGGISKHGGFKFDCNLNSNTYLEEFMRAEKG